MKQLLRHIFSLIFGIYFLIAGTGFNIINYCCNSCEDEGIENITLKSCETVHHNESGCCNEEPTHDEDNLVCENPSTYPASCYLLRLNVEIPSLTSVFELNSNHTNFEFDLIVCMLNHSYQTVSALQKDTSQLPPSDDILCLAGRDILTTKSVLII